MDSQTKFHIKIKNKSPLLLRILFIVYLERGSLKFKNVVLESPYKKSLNVINGKKCANSVLSW